MSESGWAGGRIDQVLHHCAGIFQGESSIEKVRKQGRPGEKEVKASISHTPERIHTKRVFVFFYLFVLVFGLCMVVFAWCWWWCGVGGDV